MSNFTRQTHVVTLPNGDTVTLRKLDFGRKQAITDAAVMFGPNMEPIPTGGRARKTLLYQSIVSWSGPGFEGLPPTPENIDLLDPDIAEYLLTEADKLSAALTDDEKKA